MRENQPNSIRRLTRKLLTRLMLSCDGVAELTSQALDEKLSLLTRFRVGMHMMVCRFCRRYQRHLLLIRSILGPSVEEISDSQSLAPNLPAAAKVRIHDAIMKSNK